MDEYDWYARASDRRTWHSQREDEQRRSRQRPLSMGRSRPRYRSVSRCRGYQHHSRSRSRSPRTTTYRSKSLARDQRRRSGSYGTRSRSHSAREAERMGHPNSNWYSMNRTSSFRPRSPSPMGNIGRLLSRQDRGRYDQRYMSYTLEKNQAHRASSYDPRDKRHSSPRHHDTRREDYHQPYWPRRETEHLPTSDRSNEYQPKDYYGSSLSRNQLLYQHMHFPARNRHYDPLRSNSHPPSSQQSQRSYNSSFDIRQPLQPSDHRPRPEFGHRSEPQRNNRPPNHHVIKKQASDSNAAIEAMQMIADNEQRVLETKKRNILVKIDAIIAAMDKEYAAFEWGQAEYEKVVSEPEITESDRNFADTEYEKWEKRHEKEIEALAAARKDCEAELKSLMGK